MKLYFSDQPLPKTVTKSIFLAGPSPRSADVYDWRHDALKHIEQIGFDGEVLIPIPIKKFYGESDDPSWTYIGQIKWEEDARELSDKIVFWVARDIAGHMPGFTTNVEYGLDLKGGKVVYGRPTNADKVRYLDELYQKMKMVPFSDLGALLKYTVDALGEGALRTEGEVHVPLMIWNTEQFQSWYSNLKQAGNKLISAKLLQHLDIPGVGIFSYVMSVNVWIEKEKRFKTNEFIFSRKDISSVIAYYPSEEGNYVAFIKEFRSPVNNTEGIVYELPSGSSAKNVAPEVNAQHELFEETGLLVKDVNRFQYVATKQLVATISTHQAHTYKIKLEKEEFDFLMEQDKNAVKMGNIKDSEITYVCMINEKDFVKYPIDYANLGMIFSTLYS
jgi:8-oxo-dGTP pyrophosphatase MutT (NUDIX family)